MSLAMMAESRFDLSPWYVAKALAVLAVGAALVLQGLPTHHPFRSIGSANLATAARGTLVALLAALVGERFGNSVQYVALAVATTAATLDGVDGWLARKTNTSSRFGARFDMETDALLILTLAVLAWQFGKAGIWILLSGAMRYLFVLASLALPWLRAPLPHSFRRKAVAVLQTIALLVAMAPFVPNPASALIAGIALSRSLILLPHRCDLAQTQSMIRRSSPPSSSPCSSSTARSRFTTSGRRSASAGPVSCRSRSRCCCSHSISNAVLGRTSPRVLAFLAVMLLLFAIGRYGEVTAPALYGREINLYWDAQHVGALAGMLTAVAPTWMIIVGALALLAALALLYLGARWSLGTLDEALRDRKAQIGFGIAATVLIALFVVQRLDDRVPRVPQFSIPVSNTYAVQIARVLDTFASSAPPAHSPRHRLCRRTLRPSKAEMCSSSSWNRMDASPTTALKSRPS